VVLICPGGGRVALCTKVLTAFHLERFIVPCVLSNTELPQFLSRSVYFDLSRGRKDALERLGEQVRRAPRSSNEFPSLTIYQSAELEEMSRYIASQQAAALDLLGDGDLSGAAKMQAKLGAKMRPPKALALRPRS
jgi:hypothetical protein